MLSLRSLLLFGIFNLGVSYGKHDLVHRSPSAHRFTVAESPVDKAQLGRRSTFTWFVTGLGACGGTNVPSDFIVALPAVDWDNGAHCFETITITINGKSTQAQIVDECMNCASGDLDFTTGLYSFFDPDTSNGVLEGSWEYGTGSGNSGSGNSGSDETTTTTKTKKPKTSTTTEAAYTPPTTSVEPTSTYTPSSVQSSVQSSSSSPPSSSSVISSSSAFLSAPSTTATSTATGGIALLDSVLVHFANVVLAAQLASEN